MNLILTSDLPVTANQTVFDRLRAAGEAPRIVFIPPFTDLGRKKFARARQQFESFGFPHVDYCDIDADMNSDQVARLDEYDVIYLSGGDPLRFRVNMRRSGLEDVLQRCLDAGRTVVGASGGAMQLSKNVSLFRLVNTSLDEVLAGHQNYQGLGLVDCEVLPHLNRFGPAFIETVRRYSAQFDHDVVALVDGAALLSTESGGFECVGQAAIFRKGELVTPEEP